MVTLHDWNLILKYLTFYMGFFQLLNFEGTHVHMSSFQSEAIVLWKIFTCGISVTKSLSSNYDEGHNIYIYI